MSFLLRSLLINKVLKTAKIVAPLAPLVAKTAIPIYAANKIKNNIQRYVPWIILGGSAFVGILILK
jgi:hypothetical protein